MLRGKRACTPASRALDPFLSPEGGRVIWSSWESLEVGSPGWENLELSGGTWARLDVSMPFLQSEDVSFLYHPCAHPWLKLQLALLAHTCVAQPSVAPDSSLTQDRVSAC